MARIEHHCSYAFLIYYIIYLLWKGPEVPGWTILLVIFFSLFPDLDTIYWLIKEDGKIDTQFQHHLYYWTHWPISYSPLILFFIISLFLNLFPLYFLIPIVGIYCGHLIPDSISTGDGIMWGKIPWKKMRYSRYINLWSKLTDGYHGKYWETRYRKTIFFKLGTSAVIFSLIILMINLLIQLISNEFGGFYLTAIIFFLSTSILGFKRFPKEFCKEPPEGRYADYRINPEYINGLSQKNRERHLQKFSEIIKNKRNLHV